MLIVIYIFPRLKQIKWNIFLTKGYKEGMSEKEYSEKEGILKYYFLGIINLSAPRAKRHPTVSNSTSKISA